MFDCSRSSNLGDQLTASSILNGLKSDWKRTLYFFAKSQILQLPELVTYMTLCYMKEGLVGPVHVHSLWTRLASEWGTGRYSDKMLTYQATPKQWLHNLAPIAQVKLWNGHLRGAFKDKCECLSSSSVGGFTEAQEDSFERPEFIEQLLFFHIWHETTSCCSKTSVKLPTMGYPFQFLKEKNLRKKSSVEMRL